MQLPFKTKHFVDVFMVSLLPLLMAYSLIGEELHEWIGTAMLALTVIHNLVNAAWYRNLFRGKYTPVRILQTILNIASLLCIIGLAISGVMLSHHVFEFIPQLGGGAFVRTVHMLCSYWGFLFMSLHTGMHINLAIIALRKKFHIEKVSKQMHIMLHSVIVAVCCYGTYAFFKRDIASYLFLKTPFVFFDFNELFIFFLADYMAIVVMFICCGYYILKLFMTISRKKIKSQSKQ